MKTIALLVFLFSISAHCYAQVDQQKLLYVQKSEKYRKMKNTGRILTVLGGVLFVTSIVTAVNSVNTTTGTSTQTSNGEYAPWAHLGGVAGLGAGIPLWIVGGYQQRKYEAKLQNLSVRINAAPQNRGLTLTYRF